MGSLGSVAAPPLCWPVALAASAGTPNLLHVHSPHPCPALLLLLQAVLPIVRAYPQIETCMECSAQKLQFVGEVFYYALKAGGRAGRRVGGRRGRMLID